MRLALLALGLLLTGCAVRATPMQGQSPAMLKADKAACRAGTDTDRGASACLVARGYRASVFAHGATWGLQDMAPRLAAEIDGDLTACEEQAATRRHPDTALRTIMLVSDAINLFIFPGATGGVERMDNEVRQVSYVSCLQGRGYVVGPW